MNSKPRNTRQKKMILEELKNVTNHPTASELYEMVRIKLPKVSLGTVYRNLEQMSEKGEILKIYTAGRKKRFDANIELHNHVRCTKCGRINDIPEIKLNSLKEEASRMSSFKISGLTVEFEGICPKCQKK